ncbi:hypothetical protein GOBAR_DD33437 [Gossypium barbadense]|nr:hypothetical protein GOBAR_DD33437 [Gossypium barbadense]
MPWWDTLDGKPSTNRSSQFMFGDVYVIDDPLTIEPDINSKTVGKAQGTYTVASQGELSLLMVTNFAFTEGKYNGSTLSVLGRNEVLSTVREIPIVGGSGVFRFARGYAQVYENEFDPKQPYSPPRLLEGKTGK